MDLEARREITRELEGDEKLLWSDRPIQGLIIRARDLFPLLFGLVWISILVLGFSRRTQALPKTRERIHYPFASFGLFFTFGPVALNWLMRRTTFYALTNARAMVVSGIWQRSVRSVSLQTLGQLTLTEKRNGTGSVTFGGSEITWYMAGFAPWFPSASASTSFEYIASPRKVYEQIRLAQAILLNKTGLRLPNPSTSSG